MFFPVIQIAIRSSRFSAFRGLTTKPTALFLIASLTLSIAASELTIMTMGAGHILRISSRDRMPSILGILISSGTRSGLSSSHFAIASLPLAA